MVAAAAASGIVHVTSAPASPPVAAETVVVPPAESLAGAARSYDGHKIVAITVKDADDAAALTTWIESQPDADLAYHSIRSGTAEARIGPESWLALQHAGFDFAVVVDDLGPVVRRVRDERTGWTVESSFPKQQDDELPGGRREDDREQANAAQPGDPFYYDFRTYEEHLAYLEGLVAEYPDLATMIAIGNTLEGRTIWAVRISGGSTAHADKPGVFYHAAEHAREWITPPVVTYLARHLLQNYETDDDIRWLVDHVSWYLVPVMNVDGYVYTWEADRYWRKNRRPLPGGYYGVDLNRNWEEGWGGSGSSNQYYSNTYRGSAPFSEPETQVVRDFLLDHPNIGVHVDIHSYGSLCLWPHGHTDSLSEDDAVFSYLGDHIHERVLNVHGTEYETGTIANALYLASGVSTDWVYAALGVWSFTFELRGTGFAVHPSHIRPACEENTAALLYLARWLVDCDVDGMTNAAEWAMGTAADCNGNNVPDTCEPLDACMPPSLTATGSRYLAVGVPPIPVPVAIHITSATYPCVADVI